MTIRLASSAAAVLSVLAAFAEREPIWPEGKMPDRQPHQVAAMANEKDKGAEPYLDWFAAPEKPNGCCAILISGGGYMSCANVGPVNAWAEKGLDPGRIGIMGSSAGGHLTLLGATSSRSRTYLDIDDLDMIPCNVQWGVGIYPAYVLTDGIARHNTKGGNDDSARLVPDFAFDLDTCPMVFVHGDADKWAAMNSVKVWEQMRRMGVGCDLHTLATRPHAFEFRASPGTGSYTYLGRIWEFLNHKGFNK